MKEKDTKREGGLYNKESIKVERREAALTENKKEEFYKNPNITSPQSE